MLPASLSWWSVTAISPPPWHMEVLGESPHCAHIAIHARLAHPLVPISLSVSSKVQVDGSPSLHTSVWLVKLHWLRGCGHYPPSCSWGANGHFNIRHCCPNPQLAFIPAALRTQGPLSKETALCLWFPQAFRGERKDTECNTHERDHIAS